MKSIVLLSVVLALATLATAGEPVVAKVVKKDVAVTLKAEGAIEPGASVALGAAPLAYRGRHVLVQAVPPGTRVGAGDVVLRFDDREIVEAVENARFDLSIAVGDLEDLLTRQKMHEESVVEDLGSRRLALDAAEKKYRGYLDHELVHAETRRVLDEESTLFGLKNAREELRQLEAMYSEDELVDETEKIVIERARYDVRRREARYELWKKTRDFGIEYGEREREKSLRRGVALKRTALERFERDVAMGRRSRRVALLRARRALDRKKRELSRLAADLAAMTVRAPVAGIVLHGPAEGALGRRYSIGAQVGASLPVATIVDPGHLVARLSLPAKHILRVAVGQKVRMHADIEGAEEYEGVVTELEAMPRDGRLRLVVKPDRPFRGELLAGRVKADLVIGESKEALTLPAAAVLRADGRTFCRLKADGALAAVAVGETIGADTVVLGGLAEGDEVLLPPPPEEEE